MTEHLTEEARERLRVELSNAQRDADLAVAFERGVRFALGQISRVEIPTAPESAELYAQTRDARLMLAAADARATAHGMVAVTGTRVRALRVALVLLGPEAPVEAHS